MRIEPAALQLDLPATLRLPYRPLQVGNTSPGNVRGEQVGDFGTRQYEPFAVDVAGGQIALRVNISLAWNRADLGTGQRDYDFWFSPGRGLIAFAQDGDVRQRTGL
ncbi:MAG: hypothetical protein ABIP94_22685 [Planctomycetota bacterium]